LILGGSAVDLFKDTFSSALQVQYWLKDIEVCARVYGGGEGMLYVAIGRAYQQKPLCLKDRTVLPHINCLKDILLLCCESASGNHRLKLVVIAKAKRTLSLKGTKVNCIPAHITTGKEHG
jgi:hypothetical protein